MASKKKQAPKKAAKPAPKKAVSKKAATKKTVKKSAPVSKKVVPKKVSKPVAKPASKAAAKPAPKVVSKPATKAAVKPVAKPVTKVAVKVEVPPPPPVVKKAGGIDPKSLVSIKPKVQPITKKEPPKPSKMATPKTTTRSSVKYEPEFTKSVLDTAAIQYATGPTMRYSDVDLTEFREVIQKKLDAAKKELSYLQGLIPVKTKAAIWTKAVT